MASRKKKPPKPKKAASSLEDDAAALLAALGLPPPVREHFFAKPDRKWRFDLAYPTLLIAFEIEGGHWIRGRHQRPLGFEADCEKYSNAAARGWIVLRFTSTMLKDGRAAFLTEMALAHRRKKNGETTGAKPDAADDAGSTAAV